MHESHFRLDHNIVTCSFPIGTCLPIAGDARIYQAWINLANGLVIHVIFLQSIGKVILDQYIAVFDELVQDLDTRGLLKGETKRLLVPVDLDSLDEPEPALDDFAAHRQEVCTLSGTIGFVASNILCIRWTPCSCVISSYRVLDFDDFSS